MGAAGSVVLGILTIVGGVWMRKPGKARTGGVLALVFSVVALFFGGGFLIGSVLGIVGGILGIVAKKK